MPIVCEKCEGSGYINANNLPQYFWAMSRREQRNYALNSKHVTGSAICDCCGNNGRLSNWWKYIPGYYQASCKWANT